MLLIKSSLLHRTFNRVLGLTAALTGMVLQAAGLTEVQAQIDAATGKPKDTKTVFTVSGAITARYMMPDQSALAFLQTTGDPGVALWIEASEASKLPPRQETTLKGTLTVGPLGLATLKVATGSLTLGSTNKPVATERRGGAFFSDPSSLAGRLVTLTNMTLSPGTFGDSGRTTATDASGAKVSLIVGPGVKGLEAPTNAINIAGIPVRVDGTWHLLAARFLPDLAAPQKLAAKHLCLTCHNPDQRIVGPTYREVAARYRRDPEAFTKLTQQIVTGGTGKWGVAAMPALGTKVSADDRATLIHWIMGYRWDALLAE